MLDGEQGEFDEKQNPRPRPRQLKMILPVFIKAIRVMLVQLWRLKQRGKEV